jgi:hypothetical protein
VCEISLHTNEEEIAIKNVSRFLIAISSSFVYEIVSHTLQKKPPQKGMPVELG